MKNIIDMLNVSVIISVVDHRDSVHARIAEDMDVAVVVAAADMDEEEGPPNSF